MRIGIDLGGTKIEGVVLDADGTITARIRRDSPQNDYAETLAAITRLVTELEAECGRECSIGMGIPGTISGRTGLVKNANSTWLIGNPLKDDLERALNRPVRLANDANCFALSEATDGAARGAAIVFGVILGTGVGGGLVIDGRVVDGPNGIAGEWGHNPLPWPQEDEIPGPPCYCGKSGCIETFLSGPGLSKDDARNGGAQRSAQDIASAADPRAEESLRRYEDRLARALASVINVVDPDVIVLGGGLSNMTRLYDSVAPLLERWVFSDTVETVLKPPVHGDSSGVRGAAWLWPNDD